MKVKSIVLSLAVVATLFTGCAKKAETTATPAAPKTTDAVATASIVDNADAFQKAIASNGKWIIAITKDVTTDKDLVLDGEFKNGKKDEKTGKDAIQRKIALYSQDDKRNITARFTLTAPSLTIKSPVASIQHGTFKGDVYVTTNDFQLVDATVEGNVYFANDAAKAGFKMDNKSKITGTQDIKAAK